MKTLLAILNVNTEEEGVAELNTLLRFIDRLKDATGAKTSDELLTAVQSLAAQRTGIKNAIGGDKDYLVVLSELKSENQSHTSFLAKLNSLTGKSGEETYGTIVAWKADAERVPGLQKQISDDSSKKETDDLNAAFTAAHTANKITPAMETEFRKQLNHEDPKQRMSPQAMIATLSTLQPIKALANQPQQAAGGAIAGAAVSTNVGAKLTLTHNGKTYDQLEPMERHALWEEDRATHDAMRNEWVRVNDD